MLKENTVLVGRIFGRLTVVSKCEGQISHGSSIWNCLCECGNTKKVVSSNLLNGGTKSCGCLRFIDLTGRRYGKLFVKEKLEERGKNGQIVYLCVCDCGSGKNPLVLSSSLTLNIVRSCGCLNKEIVTTHNSSYKPIYFTWTGIKTRCLNEKSPDYPRYGGRGIKICDRWLNSFENFYEDMGDKPGPEYSLDRINSDGDYEKDNCRWATMIEQQNNRRNTLFITYKDKKYSISNLAREKGIEYATLRYRIENGWSVEDAVEKSLQMKHQCNYRIIEYDGKKQTLIAWANEKQITYRRFNYRVINFGIEAAMTAPSNIALGKHNYLYYVKLVKDGVVDYLEGWVRRLNVSNITILKMIKEGEIQRLINQ